ncbi:MAG: ATP-binding protein [Polyangiaceae bacterium]
MNRDLAAPSALSLDLLPEALIVLGEGEILLVNARTARLLKWSAEELEGRDPREVFAPGELERLEELDRQQQQGWEPPETLRLRLRARDGTEVPVDVRFSRDQSRLVLCARDFTEASRAEKLMRDLAAVAARLSSTGDVVGLLRACEPFFVELGWTVAYSSVDDTSTIPRYVCGPPADPIAEYGRSLIGKRLPPEASPIAAEVVRRRQPVFLDDLPSSGPARIQDARALDDRMRVAQVRRSAWCPIWVEGQIVALLSAAGRDLTDHDFVALQLMAAQLGATARTATLQRERIHRERLAAMGEVTAVLAHEIRNPLAVIANASAVLRRVTAPVAAAAAPLDMVDEEIQRLKTLMSDVLDFARPTPPEAEAVGVRQLIEDAVASVRFEPAATDCQWDIAVADSVPAISGQRPILQRIFANLMANACRHVPRGGKVVVRATGSDHGVRVTVFNEGAPVPDEARPHVFEPFFTTRQEGTGLGLFVVHRSVQLLGGSVVLDPRTDGVQFNVELPSPSA